MQGVAAGAGIIDPGDAAQLDRIGGHPVDDQALLDDVRRGGEGGIHLGLVAGLVDIGLVVRAFVVELRRVRCEGVARRYDSGPRLIVDDNTFGGVERLVERIGDRHRDRVTHMHHAVERNRRPRRQEHRAAAARLVGRHRRQRAEAVGAIILPGEHGMDARHLQRRARLDAGDAGMGMRRAHDRRMQLIGELEIVEKAALPPQQARVLAPQHRLSDGKFTHDLSEPRRSRDAWRRRMKGGILRRLPMCLVSGLECAAYR